MIILKSPKIKENFLYIWDILLNVVTKNGLNALYRADKSWLN